MNLSLLTDTTTLVETKVLSARAKKACAQLGLDTVGKILAIPVKAMEQMCKLTRQPVRELSRLHEAFDNPSGAINSFDLVQANLTSSTSEFTKLVKGYAYHYIMEENDKRQLRNVFANMNHGYSEEQVELFLGLFTTVYDVAAKIFDRKHRLEHFPSVEHINWVTIRYMARDVIVYTRDNLYLNRIETEYFDDAYSRFNRVQEYYNTWDKYLCLKIDRAKYIDEYFRTQWAETLPKIKGFKFNIDFENALWDMHNLDRYHITFLKKPYKRIYLAFLKDLKQVINEEFNRHVEDLNTFNTIKATKSPVAEFLYLFKAEDTRNSKIRRDYAGLNEEAREYTLDELSKKYSLTRPTLRYILCKPFAYYFGEEFRERFLNYIENRLGHRRMIPATDPAWNRIIEEGGLDISLRQLMKTLAIALFRCDVLTAENSTDYFLQYFEAKDYPFKTAQKRFAAAISRKYAQNTVIDVSDFFYLQEREEILHLSVLFEDIASTKSNVTMLEPMLFSVAPTNAVLKS